MRKQLHNALLETMGIHSKQARQDFMKIDLSAGQPKVLTYLLEHEGCQQSELAINCSVEPATMTVLLRNMSKSGLIQKKAKHVSCGKRAYSIYFTDLGREKANKAQEFINDLEEKSYKGFTEEEKDTLILLLQRIVDNLS